MSGLAATAVAQVGPDRRLASQAIGRGEASPTAGVLGGLGGVALAGVLYVGLSLLAYWPVLPFDGSHFAFRSADGDLLQLTWFMGWVPHALAGGHNPFFSHVIDVPRGINVATNPSMPLLGVLAAPVTALAGPVAGMNALLHLALAGSALSMFAVLRSWTRRWPAAFAGGLLYGFGSYVQYQGTNHVDLSFLVLPPIFFWLLAEALMVGRWRPGYAGIALGVVATAQELINAEVFAGMMVLAAAGIVVVVVAFRHEVRRRLARTGLVFAVALGTFAVLDGYPLWVLLEGPGHLKGPFENPVLTSSFRQDLFDPVVRRVVLAVPRPGHLAAWESPSGYLGWPLLVAMAALMVAWRRVVGVWLPAILAAVAFVLSLGWTLSVGGHDTGVPMPERLFAHLPLLSDLVPLRLTWVETLFLAVVLAVGLDRTAAALPRLSGGGGGTGDRRLAVWRRWLLPAALVALSAAVLVPVLSGLQLTHGRSFRAAGPDNPVTHAITRSTPPGGVVLTLPRVNQAHALPMLWQADADYSYRLVGGYSIVPDARAVATVQPIVTKELGNLYRVAMERPGHPTRPESVVRACRALPTALRQYGVSTVVLWRSSHVADPRLRSLLTTVMGRPPVRAGSVLVWDRAQQRARSTTRCSRLAAAP